MASPNPTPYIPPPLSDTPPAKQAWHQKHGTTVALLTLAVSVLMNLFLIYSRSADADAKKADEHTNALIDQKVVQASNQVNQNIDAKMAALGSKIDKVSGNINNLSDRVSRIEGSLGNRISGLDNRISGVEDHAARQASLAKLTDPSRTLALIREEIALAKSQNKTIPAAQLVDYKNAVQGSPTSAYQYWTTAAAVINYQSHLLQMSGEAPDPTKVSKRCGGITKGTGGNNIFAGMVLSNCVVDLDATNDTFDSVLFKNSVIRYSGGQVKLRNVHFQNCNFQLELSTKTAPQKPEFLVALLESSKQTSVEVK